MTDQRKVQLGVAVDATGAKAGFDQVKAGAKDMAQAVAAAGQQGAKGLDGIGAGGTEAASKLDKNTKSMIGSVQRATAAMQAGERGSAKYFETLAQQRGVSSDVLKPYIDQLRQAEAAQAAAQGSLGKMGISAKQTAAAMRGVPAQFTDIFTSIQGGQAPLTVLLQQGGQLKDMFGGAGAAAKALGGYVLGLISPLTVAAAAVGGLAYAFMLGEKESKAYETALTVSGSRAGVTAGQLAAAAQNMAAFGTTQGRAAEALVQFANAGVQGARGLEEATAAAITWEKATGTSIDKVADNFKELRRAPLETTLKLNEALSYMTTALYQQIKALEDQGRATEAADVAQKAYADTLSSRGAEILQNLGYIERSWNSIKDAVKGAWDAAKDFGRDTTLEDKIAALTSRRDQYRAYGYDTTQEDASLAAMTKRLMLQRDSAQLQSQSIIQAEALAKWDKNGLEFLSKKERQEREIQKVRNEGVAAGLRQVEIEARIQSIREKYAEKSTPGDAFAGDREAAKEWAKFYEDAIALSAKAKAEILGLNDAQKKLVDFLGSRGYQEMAEPARQLALQEYYAAISAEQLRDELKATAKEADASQKAYESLVQAQDRAADNTADQLKKQLEHNATIGMSVDAIGEQEAATLRLTAAELDRKANLQDIIYLDGRLADATREQAQNLRDLADAKAAGAQKKAAYESAKAAVEEWKKAADKISDTITDALMRGFESGKGFIENLRDTIVNTFKTMVLRPVISAIVSPVAGALAAGAGYSGSAAAEQGYSALAGAGNAGNAINGVSVLGSMKGWLTDFGGGVASQVSKLGNYLSGFSNSTVSEWGNSLMDNASAIGGYAQAAGTALGYINAAVAASKGQWGAAIGSAVGTYFGGPIGAAIGNAVGGWVDSAFGGGSEYTTGTGISGKFSSSGFSGRSFQDWRNDGSSGFFGLGASGSSSGTNYSALDASTAKGLGTAFASVQAQTAGFADALGLSADAIMGFSKDVRVTLGSDAEANKKALQDLLTGIADDLAKTVLDTQYMREAETAASTLARLATNLSAVNSVFETMGKSMLTISQAGGDSASQLVDLLGGLEQFNSTTLSYYQTFYTEAERNAKTAEQLSASFAQLGVALPDSLQAYRDLVNAQDINTESGRKMYASLMGLSGAFATVTNAAADAASTLLKAMRFSTYVDYAAAVAGAGSTPAPRFASGGMHSGGLRVVGENGPELEATGPSRIWNDSQLRSAMSGSEGAATAAELSALRADFRAQSRAQVSINARILKLFATWDANGMPEVRTV